MIAVSQILFFYSTLFCAPIFGIDTVHRDSRPDLKYSTSFGEESEIIKRYEPTWESLDSRPLPSWYDDAKFGIFIHWGVFSVPSFDSEWFWKFWKSEKSGTRYRKFMEQRYPPSFTYQDFAKDFTAEFYDANEWSKIFEASGAKYVVLTSKHHEGYTMWPSKYSFGWNSMDVGPNRDLVGELADAIRDKTTIKFGLYHSLYEWYNPVWLNDVANNFTTSDFVNTKSMPEMHELIELYEPDIVWSDGSILASDTYWRATEFLAWLFNDSPVRETVVANDRWGGISCHHGSFYTCTDYYNPGVLQTHKWENAMTIDRKAFGYRRNAKLSDHLTIVELVKQLVSTVSCGGNLLMNIAPTKDGIIAPIFQERLQQMGDWLSVNGEAIYNTRPWRVQNDTMNGDVWYTMSRDEKTVYACILSWPPGNILLLGAPQLMETDRLFLLQRGENVELGWMKSSLSVEITLPAEAHMGQPGWVIRFQEGEFA